MLLGLLRISASLLVLHSLGCSSGGGSSWFAPLAFLGVAWHRLPCHGCAGVARVVPVCGTRRLFLLGTWSCAVVVAGGVPLWRASWSRVVCRASSGQVALGALVGFPNAVVPLPTPGAFSPSSTGRLRGALGGRRRTGLNAHRWPPPRRGRWARSASYPFGALRRGCPWRVHPASVLGCVRCGSWCLWTPSLTRPVSRTVRRSTGDSVGAPGLFPVDADSSPCGSEDAPPGSRACVGVIALLGRVGWAGLPGAFWCASPFLWPFCPPALLGSFRAGLGASGWCVCLPSVVVFFFAPVVSCFLWVPAPVALGLCAFCLFPPPPLVFCFGFRHCCFWFLLPSAWFGVCLLSPPFPFPLSRPLVGVCFPCPLPPTPLRCFFFFFWSLRFAFRLVFVSCCPSFSAPPPIFLSVAACFFRCLFLLPLHFFPPPPFPPLPSPFPPPFSPCFLRFVVCWCLLPAAFLFRPPSPFFSLFCFWLPGLRGKSK